MKLKIFFVATVYFLLSGCASIPPEFLSSMEKEKEGISLLNKRHMQTVNDLVENWFNERVSRIKFVKQLEVDKITIKVTEPGSNNTITVIKSEELKKIEDQYQQALELASKIKVVLINGYSDNDNWNKLIKLNSINLEMTRSLNDLNLAQRKLFSDLTGQNVPFPTDFLNEEAKKIFPKQ